MQNCIKDWKIELSSDYVRLLKIEEMLVLSMDLAREICHEMSLDKQCDKIKLYTICKNFTENMEVATCLVNEAIDHHQNEKMTNKVMYNKSSRLDVLKQKVESLQKFVCCLEDHWDHQVMEQQKSIIEL